MRVAKFNISLVFRRCALLPPLWSNLKQIILHCTILHAQAFSLYPIDDAIFSIPGVNCETQCPPGLYGEHCEKECLCLNNSSCDPNSGKCICNRGWTGDTCGDPCSEGFYGLGCKEKCPDVVYGNKSCDHVTGEYVCRPGYIGLTCEHPCPAGTYGPHCSLKCMCEHGAECSHITGQCQCAPGWTGSSCKLLKVIGQDGCT